MFQFVLTPLKNCLVMLVIAMRSIVKRQGLGLGTGIKDWDWGLRLGTGIGDWDWGLWTGEWEIESTLCPR